MLFGAISKSKITNNFFLKPDSVRKRRVWGRSPRNQKQSYNLKLLLNFYKKKNNQTNHDFNLRFFLRRELTFRQYYNFLKKRNLYILKFILFNFYINRKYVPVSTFFKLDRFFFKKPILGSKPRLSFNYNLKNSNKNLINEYNLFYNKILFNASVWPTTNSISSLLFNNQFFFKKGNTTPTYYTIYIKGPRLFAQLDIGQLGKTSPILVLTATETAILLNGKRSEWSTPLVQQVILTSLRRALLALNVHKFKLRILGAIRNIKNSMKTLLTPQNEVFTQPVTNEIMWDISLGPWTAKPTKATFVDFITTAVELTPDFDKTADWVKLEIDNLINKGYCRKYYKVRFLYRLRISEIQLKTGKNYSNIYSHLWRRKLRSLARRQTKRLVKQTKGRFWIKHC